MWTHAYDLFDEVNPSHICFSSFPAAFYFPQHHFIFQIALPSHDVPKVED